MCFRGRIGGGFPLQIGELVHVVVERRKHSVPGIAQHLVEATFLSLAWASRMSCGISGNMAMKPEMWKLVGLHADKTDQRLATRLADFSDNPVRLDPPVGFRHRYAGGF